MTVARPEERLWNDRVFWAIVAASLVVKLTFAILAAGIDPVNDEPDYVRGAYLIAEGKEWTNHYRPPLYIWFFAAVVACGGNPDTVRIVQALLATLCLLPIYGLARTVGGRGTARTAAVIVAFDPVLTGFSHLLLTETVYLTLLLPGALLLIRDPGAKRLLHWGGAALLFGLATLARPQLAIFAPFLVLWAAWQASGRGTAWLRGVAVLATGMAIVVLPWSARNYATTGSFFLVDTNGPFNIALGAEPRARFIDKDDNWNRHWARVGGERYINVAQRDPGRAQRLALRRWVRHVSADPLGYAAGSLWEASHLFTLDDFIGRHLRNRWYGKDLPKWLTGVYAVSASLFTALLFLGGGIALVAQPASPLRNFSVLVVVHAVMLFGLTFSLSRYSVPLRPFFAVAVAWLVTHRGEVMKRLAENRLRAIVAALVALFLLGSWSRDLPMLKDMVVDGGKNHRFTRGR